MTRGDPAEQAVLRLEARRFTGRCEMQVALIQRADTLRELSRLANMPVPYRVGEDQDCRDASRHVTVAAEERARELVAEHIERLARAEPERRDSVKGRMLEDWANLTGGPLGHLRAWAQGRLMAAELPD